MKPNSNLNSTKKRIIDIATQLFIEKGYEQTRIQDIVAILGLTKGTIYYHFKSKESIFEAVTNEMTKSSVTAFSKILENDKLNGAEKLKELLKITFNNQDLTQSMNIAPNLFDNPRFLSMILIEMQEITIPLYILPIIKQGINDGSIKSENPNELSELIVVLLNIWLNPLMFSSNNCFPLVKAQMINNILKEYNIMLFDDKLLSIIAKF